MKPRMLIRLPLVLAAILATAPASAQLYKWVDGHGVTNYSNQPPADPKAAKKLGLVENTISVYTPDKPLTDAVAALQQQRLNSLAERVRDLERQLEAERQSRQYATAAPPADPCLDNRGINCGIYSGYYPYIPAVAVIPFRNRPRITGTFPARPLHTASMSRGFPTR